MLHRGTPLYGQPAWWGDGDADDQQPGRPEEKSSDRKREKAETGIYNAAKTLLYVCHDVDEAVIHVHQSMFQLQLYFHNLSIHVQSL